MKNELPALLKFLTPQEKEEIDLLLSLNNAKVLWPSPYDEDSPESAFKFLTECCWTFNESGGTVELIPPHEYIRVATNEWWECKRDGQPLIIEKSRRLIISWVFRGLELWRSGLAQEKGVVAGLNYPKASEHCWRIWWLYEQLRKKRRGFNLEPSTPRGGNVAKQQIGTIILPNGSLVETLNQEGESFQGSGYSWVTMEEFSLFANCDYMYAQALRVVEGKPGDIPGHVTIITNASSNKSWHDLKSPHPPKLR